MNNKQITYYIDGLIDMLNATCKYLGLSYIVSYYFNVSNYINEFKKFFEIDFDDNELYLSNETFTQALKEMIGEEDVSKAFQKNIEEKLQDIEIIRFNNENKIFDKLGGSEGLSYFYFVEDLFFIKSKEIVICLMLGNNE